MNIMANATMTLVIEFMSVPNPILDNGKSIKEMCQNIHAYNPNLIPINVQNN